MRDKEEKIIGILSIIELIENINARHAKKIRENIQLDDDEYVDRFAAFLTKYESFLVKGEKTLSYAVECYMKMIDDMIYEQVQFVKTGKYSCLSFEDANKKDPSPF